VVEVEHGRDAIEAEAVKMEFLEPVADVRQEEALDFVLGVVEAEGIPRDVIAAAGSQP